MRVSRSFAFLDLSGFTALTELEGDERATALLSAFRALVRDICSRRGVRIAKWLGDGAMLVGVDTEPLVASCLEFQVAAKAATQPIHIRCGMAGGDVILLEGDDYIGHCVNVAARLCDLASGGEVLAGPGIVDGVPKWGEVTDEDDVAIRGLEHHLHVARLALRQLQGRTELDPICRIPLNATVADNIARDPLGLPVFFCSDSCRDTWDHRPRPASESQGSLRMPLIGS